MANYRPIPALSQETIDRFWSKVEVHQPAGCWEWTGTVSRYGYGRVGLPSQTQRHKSYQAHRVAYTLLIGPIPDGLTLDHLCRNTRCVNPDHLEAVPPGVNALRAFGAAGRNARKTHCIHGHELTPENTTLRPDQHGGFERVCRICKRASAKRLFVREEWAVPVACLECGSEFVRQQPHQACCSSRCSEKRHNRGRSARRRALREKQAMGVER